MDSIQILVEGSGDVLFLRQLISHIDPRFSGAWNFCAQKAGGYEPAENEYQPPTLTYRADVAGRAYVIRAMNGVKNIFPINTNVLKSYFYKVNSDDLKIVKNIIIVDADDASRGNGSGGIVRAHEQLRQVVEQSTAVGKSCAGFAMPDDAQDGTLEDLLLGMIPVINQDVVNVCWSGFKACARSHGALFDLPPKSLIDVYSKLFNRDANAGIFASSSFKDHRVWDWDAAILEPLKNFLKRELFNQ